MAAAAASRRVVGAREAAPRCDGVGSPSTRGRAITANATTAEGAVAAVGRGVEEARYRNGISVAWLRIGLRLATLALWLSSAGQGAPQRAWSAPAVDAVHLAFGVAALLLLRRRWQVPRLLLAAALVDVLVVASAGWSVPPGDHAAVASLVGVMELVLLLAALVLPPTQAGWLAAGATAWLALVGLRGGLAPHAVLALVVVLGAFSVAVTWAGARTATRAARRAVDEHAGDLARAHRDELARASRELTAERDRVLAIQAESEAAARLVVHDLKNPLAALLQFVSLAESRLADVPDQGRGVREAREDLRLAGEEGLRLSGMVGDLLLVSRLEHGLLSPRRQHTPVAALLEQAARASALRAADRQVAVAVVADADLMHPLDLDLVRRLVENLLANALRLVERGGRIELAAAEADGGLALAVRHTGRPLPEAVRPHLFEKHAPAAVRQLHGAGLALYLCRLVAEAHGGRLRLAEAPGWAVSLEAWLPPG